jgi:regulatory protein
VKITAIKQQVKNPDRASIFVDGKYSFSLTLDELVRERLASGQELDETQLKLLKKLSEEGKLRMKALNWVLLRPHSIREFRDYLYRKKAEPELIDALVEEFEGKKYLDDAAFARWWYEQRSAGNRSDRYIRSELMKKGVSREALDEVMREMVEDPETSEEDRLQTLIAKKRRLSRYAADETRLMQYLVRQGFSYDTVKRAMSGQE